VIAETTTATLQELVSRVARFLLEQQTKVGNKITKMALKYQMAIKCAKMFHPKTFLNIPKLAFLVRKNTIWQPCLLVTICRFYYTVQVKKEQRAECQAANGKAF
jgi:hypothetical protein